MLQLKYVSKWFPIGLLALFVPPLIIGAGALLYIGFFQEHTWQIRQLFLRIAFYEAVAIGVFLILLSGMALVENGLRKKHQETQFFALRRLGSPSESRYWMCQLINFGYFAIGAWVLLRFSH